MKAPDKIYRNEFTSITGREFAGSGDEPLSSADRNIEYIRKDALLEWAKARQKHYTQHNDDAVCCGQLNAFQQVIDKLESM